MRPHALAMLALVGCSEARTELVVRVDTELAWGPGRTVQSVQITVRRDGPGGPVRSAQATPVVPGQVELPLLVGLLPSATNATVWVEALACSEPGGCTAGDALAEQRALVRFVPGQTLVLPLLLTAACPGGRCTTAERCVTSSGACEPATRAEETLLPYAGGDVRARVDAGTADDVARVTDAGEDRSDIGDACPNNLQFQVCRGVCADLSSDPWNCSLCGIACGGGSNRCVGGRCVLPDAGR